MQNVPLHFYRQCAVVLPPSLQVPWGRCEICRELGLGCKVLVFVLSVRDPVLPPW